MEKSSEFTVIYKNLKKISLILNIFELYYEQCSNKSVEKLSNHDILKKRKKIHC